MYIQRVTNTINYAIKPCANTTETVDKLSQAQHCSSPRIMQTMHRCADE